MNAVLPIFLYASTVALLASIVQTRTPIHITEASDTLKMLTLTLLKVFFVLLSISTRRLVVN
jgi:hypothetical protein